MASLEAPKYGETKVVYGDGDVILVVGPDKVRIKVHSRVLCSAAKPFKHMLHGHFREASDFVSCVGPYELSLPADHAEAFELICNIIHLRNNSLPSALDVEMETLHQVAVISDKYDLTEAVQYVIKHWVEKIAASLLTDEALLTHDDSSQDDDSAQDDDSNETFHEHLCKCTYLLQAAYLIDDAENFYNITKKICRVSQPEQIQRWLDVLDAHAAADHLPEKFPDMMKAVNKRGYTSYSKIVSGAMESMNRSGRADDWSTAREWHGRDGFMVYYGGVHDALYSRKFNEQISNKNCWPYSGNVQSKSIAGLLKVLRSMQDLQARDYADKKWVEKPRADCNACRTPLDKLAKDLALEVDSEGVEGVCLDCLKAQDNDDDSEEKGGPCGVSHKMKWS